VCLAAPYAVYYLLVSLWHLPELALADQLFRRRVHHHLWGYSLSLLVWGLCTWGLGLALAELYARRCATRLERALDLRR
jgi:hypothetical protein